MPLIRTFVDTGILIAAARGVGDEATSALEILKDTGREFAASQFLKLEVLPKAIFNQSTLEVTFYETYFQAVRYWATDISQILEAGYREASQFGLGAMDALHIAAAVATDSQEFITTEKQTRSIHRTPSIKVISIASLS